MSEIDDERVIRVKIGSIQFLVVVPADFSGSIEEFEVIARDRLNALFQPIPGAAADAFYDRWKSHDWELAGR
jgi:hypothetical protein